MEWDDPKQLVEWLRNKDYHDLADALELAIEMQNEQYDEDI